MNWVLRFVVSVRRLIWHIFNPVTLGMRLVLAREGKVLLVRQTYDEGWWCLPGGGVEAGETLEQAARRELKEELEMELGQLYLKGIFTNFREGKSDHVVVYSCEAFSQCGRMNFEVAEWGFFDPEDLPEKTFAGHRRRIEEYYRKNCRPQTGMW